MKHQCSSTSREWEHTISSPPSPSCEVEKHDMAVTNPRRSQPRPQSHSHRDQKCNYRKPRSKTLLFHGLSDYKETLGWCNGKIRQRYFKFEYLIISSSLSALEDTSWALRSVIQIWMKTFSFNSLHYHYNLDTTSCEHI